MSNNNDLRGQIPATTPTEVKGNCNNCGNLITLPFPPIVPINVQTSSIISIPHTIGVDCGKCGIYHNVAIVNYSITLALVPMEKPIINEDKIIKPVTNLSIIKGN